MTSNAYGQATNQMAITVYTTPVFTQQPTTNFTVYAGGTVPAWPFSVATVGPPPIGYNWLSNGVPIAGSNSATFTVTGPQCSHHPLQLLGLQLLRLQHRRRHHRYRAAARRPLPGRRAGRQSDWLLAVERRRTTAPATTAFSPTTIGAATTALIPIPSSARSATARASPTSSAITRPPIRTETSAQFGYYTAAPPASHSNYVANIPNINFAITNASATFSIEAWANGDTNQDGSGVNGAGIVAKGAWSAEQFTLDTGGPSYSYRFTMRDANNNLRTASTSTNLPDGKWHHLVGVLDEAHSNLCLYVDGVKVATTSCRPLPTAFSAARRRSASAPA